MSDTSSVPVEILGGWCSVGTVVYSDYYVAESENPRKVSRITVHDPNNGRVWTEAGPKVRALPGVDFASWITKEPRLRPKVSQ